MTYGREVFEIWKQYVQKDLRFEDKWDFDSTSFRSVKKEEIENLRERIGFPVPNPLIEFWMELGFGILRKSPRTVSFTGGTNWFMRPADVADTFEKQKRFCAAKKHGGHCLPFMHIDRNDYLGIEVGNKNEGKITRIPGRSRVVALSFYDFMKEMERDIGFFSGITIHPNGDREYRAQYVLQDIQNPNYIEPAGSPIEGEAR